MDRPAEGRHPVRVHHPGAIGALPRAGGPRARRARGHRPDPHPDRRADRRPLDRPEGDARLLGGLAEARAPPVPPGMIELSRQVESVTVRTMTTRADDLIRIGELARRAGVNRGTVQHYLREGLLPRPVKTHRNMAYYDVSC